MRYAIAGWLPGGRRRCVICKHAVWRFMPYKSGTRTAPPLMQVLDMVGSDIDHFECPHCGAHDRERHLLMYLKASGIAETLRGKRVLHFAPEKHLSVRIRSMGPSRYIPCDLHPATPDVHRVNMEAMPFPDASFDVVIANHVLEHVSDLSKALGEIHRVLDRAGFAILQTPYSNKLLATWEDKGIDTPEARLHAHGQEDHVRLFGRDIFKRISDAGLRDLTRSHEELLTNMDASRYGVNVLEPFFLFQKN
ncbi:methyltransferase [Oleiagrimonas soli]|nr:methyltransferase [Oleiagrimonas soli]